MTRTRINLWSGPRNISTALMYSFAQRPDTLVFDEPLYAYYLSETNAKSYHPGANEVLDDMENDGTKVIQMMQDNHEKEVLFFKQMTHHLHHLDKEFMLSMENVILTRDPQEMLPSFAKEIKNPKMADVGYKAHLDLIEYLESKGKSPLVLDSKQVLLNPEETLRKLCNSLNIPFDQHMLKWEKGPRKEDGVWAKYWYTNVHQSTGFIPYKPKKDHFPEQLVPLLEECTPIYNELKKRSL